MDSLGGSDFEIESQQSYSKKNRPFTKDPLSHFRGLGEISKPCHEATTKYQKPESGQHLLESLSGHKVSLDSLNRKNG